MLHRFPRARHGLAVLPLALMLGVASGPPEAPAAAPATEPAGGERALPAPRAEQTPAARFTVDPQLSVTTQAAHNPDYNFSTAPGQLSYETPAYFSMDRPRSVRLVYTSAQARPVGLVQLGVHDMSGVVPAHYRLQLASPGNTLVTFLNGATVMYYAGGMSSRPITAQFDASTLATGAYTYTATVTAVYPGGAERSTSHVVRVVILNERSSELASGWTVAGLSRLSLQSGGVVISNGEGRATYFARPCSTCAFVSPPGDFSTVRVSGTGYVRAYPDSTTEVYNAVGRLSYVQDRLGNRTTFGYNAANRPSTIQDAAGLVTTLGYDAAGRLASISTPGGRVVQVTVNAAGDLVQVQDSRGVALQATYGADHSLSTYTDRNGGVTSLWYHATGPMDSLSMPAVPVLRRGAEVMVRPTWRYRSYEEAVAPPAGTGTQAVPVPQVSNTATTITGPRGHTITAYINKFGQEEGVSRPGGGTIITSYDAHGNAVYRRAPNGRESFAWWTGGQLDSTLDASTSRKVRYRYGAFGQVREVSTDQVTQTYTLNAQGLVQYSSVNGGAATTYAYDARGRVTQVTDAMGHVTRMYYNPAGWMNTDSVVGDTAGLKAVYGYDARGRLRTTRNAMNQTTTFIADALNRDSLVISPAGDTTRYSYTGSYRTGTTLPGGGTHSVTVNALGWVRTWQGPASGTISGAYDENGNLVRSVNRRGQVITYGYDAMDRLVRRTADGQTASFAYDSLGLWTASRNAEAIDTIWFNSAGQKVSAVTMLGGQVYRRGYGYDASGRQISMRLESGYGRDEYWDNAQHCDALWEGSGQHGKQECLNVLQLTHNYGTDGQLSSIWTTGHWLYGSDPYSQEAYYPVFSAGATFGYNTDRRLTSTTVGAVTFTQGYNRVHALASLSFSVDSINAVLGGTFQRDLRGRTLYRYNGGQTEFKWNDYDARGQLQRFGTGVRWSGGWTQGEDWDSPFDRNHNPADSGAVVAAGDRLQSYRTVNLGYDADGNLGSLDNAWKRSQLEWNNLGQLVLVNDDAQQTSVAMGYDARGRRVRRDGSAGTTYYLYDGSNVIAEIAPAGNIKRVYTYYPGTDRPHAMVQNDSVYYYLTDERGSVVGLARPNGSLANRYDYTPFGEIRFSRESVPNDLQFSARLLDDETGLYDFRARYYDPFLRRFISEDPSGLAGGRNLYAYAGNDPINRYDPGGLSPQHVQCRWEDRQEIIPEPDGDRLVTYREEICTLDAFTVEVEQDPEEPPYEGNPDWEDIEAMDTGMHEDGSGGPSISDEGPGVGLVVCLSAIGVATFSARDRRIKARRFERAQLRLRGAEVGMLEKYREHLQNPDDDNLREAYLESQQDLREAQEAVRDAREDLTVGNWMMGFGGSGAAGACVGAVVSPTL